MDVRCRALSSAAQRPRTYQSLVSPAAVVAWASTRTRLAPGVSAFQDATRRVKPNPGVTGGDTQAPLGWPRASTSLPPSTMTPFATPEAKASLDAKRVNRIGAGLEEAAAGIV